jgi:Secretion system C-terminal sorting domain
MDLFNQKISLPKILFVAVFLMIGLSVNGQEVSNSNAKTAVKVKIDVFPNPTTDYLTVDFSKLKLERPKIEIRNIVGSQMRATVEKLSKGKHRVDVKDYPPGYYLVVVKDDRTKFRQTVRFSKK